MRYYEKQIMGQEDFENKITLIRHGKPLIRDHYSSFSIISGKGIEQFIKGMRLNAAGSSLDGKRINPLTGNAKVYDKHPVYIRKAFQMARSKTSAKLELRDYYIEFWDNSVKARAFYQLVKHLINTGVSIDAVGFQGHFRLDRSYDWSKLTTAVAEYKKLGLEVYITEVDYGDTDQIAQPKQPQWSAQMDTIQKKEYYDFAKAAVAGGVDWICLWGVADNSNTYWRMGQNALLFNEQYQPKQHTMVFIRGSKTDWLL